MPPSGCFPPLVRPLAPSSKQRNVFHSCCSTLRDPIQQARLNSACLARASSTRTPAQALPAPPAPNDPIQAPPRSTLLPAPLQRPLTCFTDPRNPLRTRLADSPLPPLPARLPAETARTPSPARTAQKETQGGGRYQAHCSATGSWAVGGWEERWRAGGRQVRLFSLEGELEGELME